MTRETDMGKDKKEIKAVIFDCDGTLLDSERIYMSTWNIVGEEMGYTMPEELLYRTRGRDGDVTRKMYFETMGEDFPLDEINKRRKVLNEELFRKSDNVRKPGVKILLEYLKGKNIKVGVASAKTRKMTREHLEHAGLLNYFDIVLGGDMVEQNKPEPDLFLKAAEELQVSPKECLVIGDTPSDVKAAEAAGMRVIVVPDLVPIDDEMERKAWFILKRIDECIPILQKEGTR